MKGLGWIISISIGVVAKLAFERGKKKLSWVEIMVIVALSVFSGYMAAVYCEYKGWHEAGRIVVPLATLLGQGFINYIMSNWRKWIDKLIPLLMKDGNGNGKEEKKND